MHLDINYFMSHPSKALNSELAKMKVKSMYGIDCLILSIVETFHVLVVEFSPTNFTTFGQNATLTLPCKELGMVLGYDNGLQRRKAPYMSLFELANGGSRIWGANRTFLKK